MEGRFGREGTRVYLWLILVDVWQKTTKFCKAIILQLKNKEAKKKKKKRKEKENKVKGLNMELTFKIGSLGLKETLKTI